MRLSLLKKKKGFVKLAITFVDTKQQEREIVVFEDLLHKGHVIVTYPDINQIWKKKNKFAHYTWDLVETYIKVKGKWGYLYSTKEQDGVNDD
ncbi:IS6 family transposase [Bacillus cereus group sp. N11]|nr:IS6 family transposase [Bacillus cereus group sp. N11]